MTLMAQNKYSGNIHGRAWLKLLVLGFLVYLIAAGFGGLQLSLDAIRTAETRYILLAAVAIAASYVCAAVTYKLLAPKRIGLLATLLVQVAGGLVNRMLPAGLGGMGLNVFYLKKRGHSVPVAAAVAATNNALGAIGNVLLVAVSLLLFPVDISRIQLPAVAWPVAVGAVAAICILLALAARQGSLAGKLRRSLSEMMRYVRGCFARPGNSLLALLSSCLLTGLHGLGLFFVLQAIGEPQSWPVVLLAVSFGAFVGAAIPTPGGLGGAEAGIAATLVTFGVPVNVSVAAALVYRGLTYWLPLLPGYLALRIVEKRYLH